MAILNHICQSTFNTPNWRCFSSCSFGICICYEVLMAFSNYSGKSKSKNQGFYYLYLEALAIENSKSNSSHHEIRNPASDNRPTALLDLFSFTTRDLEFIVKFSEEYGADIFRQVLHSICPSIYGHELVKGALSFSIFFSPDLKLLGWLTYKKKIIRLTILYLLCL